MSTTSATPSVWCICGKKFRSNAAMTDHKRDSPKHNPPQVPAQASTTPLEAPQAYQEEDKQSVSTVPTNFSSHLPQAWRLTADQSILLGSSKAAAFHAPGNASASRRIYSTPVAFVKEGSMPDKPKPKPKKKKSKKRATGTGGGPSSTSDPIWKVNPLTGNMMDMIENENYGLCDKDCGWCGHCMDGVDI